MLPLIEIRLYQTNLQKYESQIRQSWNLIVYLKIPLLADFVVSFCRIIKKKQTSRGTCSPHERPHRLQKPKWPKGVYPKVEGRRCQYVYYLAKSQYLSFHEIIKTSYQQCYSSILLLSLRAKNKTKARKVEIEVGIKFLFITFAQFQYLLKVFS